MEKSREDGTKERSSGVSGITPTPEEDHYYDRQIFITIFTFMINMLMLMGGGKSNNYCTFSSLHLSLTRSLFHLSILSLSVAGEPDVWSVARSQSAILAPS